MEFTVLNSPKGFWRSLPEISLSFLTPNYLRPDYQSIGALLLCIRKAECLASSSQTFSHLSFPVYQDVNGVVTAVQSSVNDTTTLSALDIPVKEIGKVLPRLVHYMRGTSAGLHILFSKLDISDGFWRLMPTATTLLTFPPKRWGSHVGLWFQRQFKWGGSRACPISAR